MGQLVVLALVVDAGEAEPWAVTAASAGGSDLEGCDAGHVATHREDDEVDEVPNDLGTLGVIQIGRVVRGQSLARGTGRRGRGEALFEGPVERTRAASILRDAVAGLAYLHGTGCVHRDVKPENLLRVGGRTVVGDLGIVRWSEFNPEFTSAGTITRASVQLGSWYYMAPEQRAAPHEATQASDVYGLGVTWYELLTGDLRTPDAFAARDVPALPTWPESREWILRMTAYVSSDRPALSEIVGALSDE